MAGLAVVGLLAAGCTAPGTGTRDEGAAVPGPVQHGAHNPTPDASAPGDPVNVVKLLKQDPKVSRRIKDSLKPCSRNVYAIDTSYGDLTEGSTADIVVNVMACGNGIGMGTYVYRVENKKYKDVFDDEGFAVYGTIDRGDLVVTQQVYTKNDPAMSYPSGEDQLTYVWSDGAFVKRYQVHNDYSRAVGNESLGAVGTSDFEKTATTEK